MVWVWVSELCGSNVPLFPIREGEGEEGAWGRDELSGKGWQKIARENRGLGGR